MIGCFGDLKIFKKILPPDFKRFDNYYLLIIFYIIK